MNEPTPPEENTGRRLTNMAAAIGMSMHLNNFTKAEAMTVYTMLVAKVMAEDPAHMDESFLETFIQSARMGANLYRGIADAQTN